MGSATRITVGSGEATYIAADAHHPVEVLNAGARDVFHKTARDVDSGDTKLEAGKSVELTDGSWFITAAASTELNVREMDSVHVGDDLSVAGDATVSGAATVAGKVHAEGELEVEGDLNHDGAKVGFCGSAPVAPSTVKKAALTANELATELAKMGLVKIEA
jgi:hypothetical protein